MKRLLTCLITILLFCGAIKVSGQDTIPYKKTPDGSSLRILSMRVNNQISNDEMAPALVLLSGGGWLDFNWFQLKDLARDLSKMGARSYVVEYRTSTEFPGATPQDALEDVQDAIFFLRTNADKLYLDPDQIIAIGASVGGQMAYAACLANPRSLAPFSRYRPNLIVAYSPVIRNDSLGYGSDLIGDDDVSWFSPWNVYMESEARIVPSIIFSGSDDPLIRSKDLRTFANKATEKGDSLELILLDGVGHSMWNEVPTIYEDTEPKISAFLQNNSVQFSDFQRSFMYFVFGLIGGLTLFVLLYRRRKAATLKN
ncbi:alpha/beta hydrolase [Gilvibacter sediminis]|uniref:alpha/beta hydrolase n=1 Tax=Gilvibacter sediminis TaxID=379071 RepID=UPI0023504A6D|nr:alpha/beta hydrolase [Gilvibacter sediminis]MDC7996793.1 alpha/beta hydrolase [Gilvibacter sediminis]